MRVILKDILTSLEQDQAIVIGAIVRSTGSAPRSSGARMLVRSGGDLVGTIGGGELEGVSIAAARNLLHASVAHHLLEFNLGAAAAAQAGMVCGGRQQVLLQRIDPQPAMIELFRQLAQDLEDRKRPILLTLFGTAKPPQLQIFGPDIQLPSSLMQELERRSVKASQPFTVELDDLVVFAEPLLRRPTIHLAGAGHVAQAVADLAAIAGFAVRVMDDRAEFANANRFPAAETIEVIADFADCLGRLGPDDMVVIVTRGHLHDREVLRQALQSEAGYIGMIGSRRKRDATYAALRREGFDSSAFARVHCPIGLDLGGDTPGEIGLSIVAQLQQARTGRLP